MSSGASGEDLTSAATACSKASASQTTSRHVPKHHGADREPKHVIQIKSRLPGQIIRAFAGPVGNQRLMRPRILCKQFCRLPRAKCQSAMSQSSKPTQTKPISESKPPKGAARKTDVGTLHAAAASTQTGNSFLLVRNVSPHTQTIP